MKEVCSTETVNNKAQKNPENTPLAKCMLKMDMEEMKNLKKLFITAHFIAYWTSHTVILRSKLNLSGNWGFQ